MDIYIDKKYLKIFGYSLPLCDAGGSIGSALSTYYKISSSERIIDINDK